MLAGCAGTQVCVAALSGPIPCDIGSLPTIKARTRDMLDEALAYATKAVTPYDARRWFTNRGYAFH